MCRALSGCFTFSGPLLAAFAAVLMATSSARAATLFVSTDGADTNTGSDARPFRTIQKAADAAGPGDTVRVRAGIYAESVVMRRSGEPGRPIVFEGERGADGKRLTILDRSQAVADWVPAPEIGPGVYKTASVKFTPYSMTLDDKQLAGIRSDFMANGKGFDLLKLPADAPCGEEMNSFDPRQRPFVTFWDAIEVFYAQHKGVTYIRFRNGDDPNGKALKAAPEGGGFEIKDLGYVVIRGFYVRGARDSIVIQGPNACHNIVEENFLTNGHTRVTVTGGASFNRVRNNEMTLGYYGHDDLGAWGARTPDRKSALRLRVYRVFKHFVGNNSSDDNAVYLRSAGEGNEIYGNHIFNGLIGVSCGASRNTKVYHNVIHNMSSIGILTSEDNQKGAVDGEFFENLVYDCNINLRLHHYDNCLKGERREYHYRNLFYEPKDLGEHVYVHWNGRKMSPKVAHPELFLYQNTFVGGKGGLQISAYAEKDGVSGIQVLNNLFLRCSGLSSTSAMEKDKTLMGAFDYNWLGGYVPAKAPAWYGEHNVRAQGQSPWPEGQLPDFLLPADSMARGAGVDLSKPFAIGSREFQALPGMKPGYFKGAAPDCGAVQFGETAPVQPRKATDPGQ